MERSSTRVIQTGLLGSTESLVTRRHRSCGSWSNGCIHLYLREYEQAIREAERAIALGPSHALVHALASHILRFQETLNGPSQ